MIMIIKMVVMMMIDGNNNYIKNKHDDNDINNRTIKDK